MEINNKAIIKKITCRHCLVLIVGLLILMSSRLTAQAMQQQHGSAMLTQNVSKHSSEESKILNKLISVDLQHTTLEEGLRNLAKKARLKLVYSEDIIPDGKIISLQDKHITLEDALWKLLADTDLSFGISSHNHLVVMKSSNPKDEIYKNLSKLETVSGMVTNTETGNSLPGANILVKNSSTGAITDSTGHYSVQVNSLQDTLVFSYVGFEKKVVPIKGRSLINVELQPSTIAGNQLVVIGYGTQQQKNVNGAISTIDEAEIENTPQVSVGQLLQGRAAGVTVTQNSGEPGGATSVRIRGVTSITGNNEPLYVIDGVPVSGDATNTATGGRSVVNNFSGQGNNTVSPLSGLNPNDIKSISILKDASAEAIYGSRGANGVVIIKTKSGRAGHNKISYNGYVGAQEPENYIDLMNLQQYARLTNELTTSYGIQSNPAFSRPELLGEGTNWQKAVFQRSLMQNHNLSFSGGNDNTTYYISGGYLGKDGILIGSEFNRYTLKTNIDAHVTDWLKAGVKVNGSMTHLDQPINGSSTGAVNLALSTSPAQSVYNLDGTFAGPHRNANGQIVGQTNPIARAQRSTNTVDRRKFLGNLYAQVNLLKGLTFKSSFGGNIQYANPLTFKPTYKSGTNQRDISVETQGRQHYDYWDWKNVFNYQHTFAGKHNINFLLAQEAQYNSWNGVTATGQGFLSNDIHTLNLAQTSSATNSEFSGEYAMTSYFTRLIYSYEDKYGLTATFRADGSSKFDEDNRWGYFPSIAGHWSVANEPWMSEVNDIINTLTLKAGYGITGNQDVGNFLYSSNLTSISTGLGTGYAVANIPNPDLKWEKQKQLNVGIKLGFLDNQLSTNFEFYNKISSRFLHTLPLPNYLTGPPVYQGGIAAPQVNLGRMRNRGFDVTIQYQSPQSKAFSWSSKLTLSHYKNKVKALNSRASIQESSSNSNGYVTSTLSKTVQGKPVGLFYGYKVEGIFQDTVQVNNAPPQFGLPLDSTGTTAGDLQYKNVNGDSVINQNDRTFIGNPNPDLTFGFNNTFNYKNISFTLFLQGSYGNKILNLSRQLTTALDRPYRNQLEVASDYWTPNNKDAQFPRPRAGDGNPNLKISDRYVEDGTYLRIKNVRLGYTLPSHITQQFKVSNLRIYGAVQNLYTFTGYSGYDPDVGSFNQSALQSGVDQGRYPEARIFTLGLNVTF